MNFGFLSALLLPGLRTISLAIWRVVVFGQNPSKRPDVKVFASVDSAAADDVAKARFGAVIARMKDPARSTFAFVLYPEATPIQEAYRASEELRTLGIAPGLVVANFVLPAAACTTPLIQARWAMQQIYLPEISARFAVPVVPIPLLPAEVQGVEHLMQIGEQVYGFPQALAERSLAGRLRG
jgi:arsenite-transporting ATPase